ncbi:MAG: winged helix-turn-helix transcriptional regulator [Prolixibacteraceae bacterium]|nr:winged helix-turn-helix transcriptional regulator [Prolixibacteraceae bacterium]
MNLETPLGYLLCRARRAYKNKLMMRYKENNIELSLDQFIILHQVGLNEEVTQQELADYLQKDKSIVLRQISALIDREYVIRSYDKKDKRKKNLLITSKGYKVLEISREVAKSVSGELLSGVRPQELHVFEVVMNKIQKNGGFEVGVCCK